jgi:multimeric flavodoxin WrbA
MKAICLNCTLKRSPQESSTASLSEVVMAALRAQDVETDEIRLVDHQIEPGVVSEAVTNGDEWPTIRERILAAQILVIGTPTWIGQPSSVSKRLLERMDAFLSETYEDGETPIAYNRVAGVGGDGCGPGIARLAFGRTPLLRFVHILLSAAG